MAVNTLISPAELEAQLDTFVIVDCRFSLMDAAVGRTNYLKGHLPGAHYADLNKDLSSAIIPGKTGRHPLPERAAFISFVQRLGIQNHHKVVAYDDGNATYAARLWWLLRWLGHESVWVLDGGLNGWQGKLTEDFPQPTPSQFEASAPLTQLIDANAIETSPYLITDARDEQRYRGEVEPIDTVAGHIPGALSFPFTQNLDENEAFKSIEVLREQFSAAGLSQEVPTICYCGSGVTACNNALALCHAGHPEPVLYAGSWSEWITDSHRKIATGD